MGVVRTFLMMFCDEQLSKYGARLTSVLSGPVLGPSYNATTAEKNCSNSELWYFGAFLNGLSLI